LEIEWFVKLILIFILLLVSAFFSGSEVALFSLDQKKLKSNFNQAGILYRYLTNLISYPRRLLVTILIGNTLVNVAVSILAVSIALDFASDFNLPVDIVVTIQILIITILVLLFGELLPKLIASKNPIMFSRIAAVPLNFISTIIYPVSEIITELIRLFSSRLKFDKSKSALTQDEIVDLAKISKEKGAIEDGEHSLINGIFVFSGLTVAEVMTPRVDIVAVPVNESFKNVVSVITNSGHSRIPVYKKNLDEIIGIIFAKDLLAFLKDDISDSKFQLNHLVKKCLFVPDTKLISELLKEFQEKKIHLAIVVDEYGGTSGLITLEDIIEEVIGDIWDEYDKEENEITKVSADTFVVLGKTKILNLNEALNINISMEDEDFDTIAGFVLHKAGSIPKEDFSFESNGYLFTVKEIQKKRIKKVLIRKITS
jgi:gliding motility-associated protein GldE